MEELCIENEKGSQKYFIFSFLIYFQPSNKKI